MGGSARTRLLLTLVLLPASIADDLPNAGCATWCSHGAHCTHQECASCETCTRQIPCTPTKKEDLSHESCERWCKSYQSAAHCAACSCRSCHFCRTDSAAPAPAPSTYADTPRAGDDSTPAAENEHVVPTPTSNEALPVVLALAAMSPPAAPSNAIKYNTTAGAIRHLSKLSVAIAARQVTWDDAFSEWDRKKNGLVNSSEIQRLFKAYNLPPLWLHALPPGLATVHGVDYKKLGALLADPAANHAANLATAAVAAAA